MLLDPLSAAVKRVIMLQYNPDSITRTLQVQSAAEGGGSRSQPLRLKGAPVETIRLDAEIDATDQLEFPDRNGVTTGFGVFPQLAALETILYPTGATLRTNNALANAGTLEIAPMDAPLALFVWGKSRVLPIRMTDFSVTEEAFDAALNPIRVKVSLGMRVLSVDDVGFLHRAGDMFMSYLQAKEQLSAKGAQTDLGGLGIGALP
ncbi:hypothetical protein [Bradyrhizobium sp. USDA 3397]